MTELTQAIFLQIGRKRYQVASFVEASEMYCTARDAGGMGASQVPCAKIVNEAGKAVARVSYNGRVWPSEDWTPDQKPIYDNRSAA